MITTITLTGILLGLEDFTTIMVVMVGLAQNMFWTFVFLGQPGALCSELEQIIQGYLNGTLIGLIGCAITPTTSLTILVETTGIVGFYFFHVVTCFFNMTNFTIVWIGKLLFNNIIGDYMLCNQFWF